MLILLFFVSLTYVLTASSIVYQCFGVPLTAIMVVCSLVFALVGSNDNHRVDYSVGKEPPPQLELVFQRWLNSRQDRQKFADAGKRYPVYIIAAEGGGIYASYHLASYLARLQDTCPNFAQHVFAISSVSGGSLGGALFTALADKLANNEPSRGCSLENPPTFQSLTRSYFETDFLSPLMGALLFPDFLQRAVPFPVNVFDRARALEATFSTAWSKTARAHAALGGADNLFDRPLSGLLSPEKATPVLFLNTTSMETGARVTISPVLFETTHTAMHIARAMCLSRPVDIDLKLSSALSLSARFPWIAPVGWLERSSEPVGKCPKAPIDRGNRLYLADGGYFENSGIETAMELREQLRMYAKGADVKIIMFFVKDDFAMRWWLSDGELSHSGNGELLAPLKILLNTRIARTRSAHSRQGFDESIRWRRDLIKIAGEEFFAPPEIHHVVLDGTKSFLPLGWRLSKEVMRNIEQSDGAFSKLTLDLIQLELNAQDTAERIAKIKIAR
jgi:hypothetical protein